MDEQEDFSSFSVQDRISHTSWKARMSAYEEISSKPSLEHSHLMTMISKEKNQVALEVGLLAIKNCIDLDHLAVKDTIVNILPSLGSNRSLTKERVIDIILSMIRMDGGDFVLNSLLSFYGHKTPKVISGVVSATKECLFNYGTSIIQVKLISKQLPKLFDHRDKNVRNDAQQLTCEIYRWVGPGLMSALGDLKPVQVNVLIDQGDANNV